ncbi:MAG: phosphate ABC transporter substrate-binding protein [Candidatus Bathyarchaeia archaeon]
MVSKGMKGLSKIGAMLTLILIIISFAAGYMIGANTTTPQTDGGEASWQTGSITIAGSTAVLPIVNACAIELMKMHPGLTITVQGGGTGVGYSNIIDGVIDIGAASREPNEKEIENAKKKGVDLWLHPIAIDAICVVVHPSVANASHPLELTLQEVGKIFAGEYTYWDEVKPGLPHKEIIVVVREPGSGTRGTFEEFTMKPWGYEVTSKASVQPSNPAVRNKIETTPYSIGYIGYGFLSDKVYAIPIAKEQGKPYITPTIKTITSGEYPMSRYLYLVTRGQPESGSLVDRFIDFVRSREGQQIVERYGYLKLPYLYPAS